MIFSDSLSFDSVPDWFWTLCFSIFIGAIYVGNKHSFSRLVAEAQNYDYSIVEAENNYGEPVRVRRGLRKNIDYNKVCLDVIKKYGHHGVSEMFSDDTFRGDVHFEYFDYISTVALNSFFRNRNDYSIIKNSFLENSFIVQYPNSVFMRFNFLSEGESFSDNAGTVKIFSSAKAYRSLEEALIEGEFFDEIEITISADDDDEKFSTESELGEYLTMVKVTLIIIACLFVGCLISNKSAEGLLS